jgi:hypothetical protein
MFSFFNRKKKEKTGTVGVRKTSSSSFTESRVSRSTDDNTFIPFVDFSSPAPSYSSSNDSSSLSDSFSGGGGDFGGGGSSGDF